MCKGSGMKRLPMIRVGCLRMTYFRPCTPGHSFPIPMDREAEVRCNVSFRGWPVASLGKVVPLPNQIRHRCVSVIETSLVGINVEFPAEARVELLLASVAPHFDHGSIHS